MPHSSGPRDWSPPDDDVMSGYGHDSGYRPLRGGGHADGHGWAVVFAVTSFVLGIGSLIFALNASLVDNVSRTVWIAGFGAAAVWAGGMAVTRIRRISRGPSLLARFGIAVGIGTIAVMGYALVAISIAPSGTALPVLAQWTDSTGRLETGAAAQPASVSEGEPVAATPLPPATAVDPLEAERLALGQSLGTAAYVLEQTASADGTWPASLLVTTDASQLVSPDGITLTPLPAGTQVLYSTSSDRLQYSLTLIGPSGVTATYESTTNVIETVVP